MKNPGNAGKDRILRPAHIDMSFSSDFNIRACENVKIVSRGAFPPDFGISRYIFYENFSQAQNSYKKHSKSQNQCHLKYSTQAKTQGMGSQYDSKDVISINRRELKIRNSFHLDKGRLRWCVMIKQIKTNIVY